MGIRTQAAQALSTISSAALKHVFRRPAGNFPGKIALYADPQIIAATASKLSSGSMSVVGTNGKTTVTNLIADCLEAQGMRVVCNRTGANLDSGVATSLLAAKQSDWGVFETDELWLAKTLPQLKSRYVFLLNLFRDQLDRVGEVDYIENSIVGALESSPETVLVYNADDPCCEAIARRVSNPKIPFGIGEDLGLPEDSTNDAWMCQECEGMVEYAYRHYNQLGDYHCPECGFARSPLRFAARNCCIGSAAMDFDVMASVDQTGVAGGALAHIHADYAGTYMVYNLMAAYIGAHVAGVSDNVIQRVFATYRPNNGRLQRLEVHGKQVLLNLAKNPTGFNQNINLVAKDTNPKVVALFVNDYEGDGRDISWLWDIDFELLAEQAQQADLKVFAGGTRRNDLQLRLKYAGISAQLIENATDCTSRIQALDNSYHVYMIANYTALPDVRQDMEALAAGKGPITAPPLRVDTPYIPAPSSKDLASDALGAATAYSLVSADQPLRIVHLLPDLQNLYGDAGNVRILQKRCEWRGIPVVVDAVNYANTLDLSQADIVFIGTGPDREQRLARRKLVESRDALAAYVEDNGVLLAIGGGYQMLGPTWVLGNEDVPGVGLLDIQTEHSSDEQRLVGDVVLTSKLATMPVIGYENHAGRSTLGAGLQPFGTVVGKHGAGNNENDDTDGVCMRNLVATNLHGPLLSKNPEVADWLIERALERRGGQSCALPKLDDSVEQAANRFMCERLGVR